MERTQKRKKFQEENFSLRILCEKERINTTGLLCGFFFFFIKATSPVLVAMGCGEGASIESGSGVYK